MASDPGQPLEVRTRFERFPLAIKGAFVMRGADGNPHAARVVEAVVERVPSGARHPFPVEDRLVDVAPTRDLFVPFEAPVNELPSGWYVIASSVEVDGRRPVPFTSRPFTVPWPRNDVRRGTVRVDRFLEVAGEPVRLVRLEMGADSAALVWDAPGGADPPLGHRVRRSLAVSVDGSRLDVLPDDVRSDLGPPGEHVVLTYPIPRSGRQVEVATAEGEPGSARVLIPLS